MEARFNDAIHSHSSHHLSHLATVLNSAIRVTFSVTSRLAAWTRWTSAPVSQESWTLYRGTAVFIVVITALRVSKGWCFGNGVYLRRRVLLLAHIRTWVLEWEARCLDEVEACCADVDGEATSVLTALLGADGAATMVESWKGPSSPSCARTRTSFYGITCSMAFSPDLPLEEMLELAYVAPYVLHLHDDRAWLERFIRLLQYILLRRVSLMEEARLYAQLYRRMLFPVTKQADGCQRRQGRGSNGGIGGRGKTSFLFSASKSRVSAWRLHRRPTWLVPLAAAASAAPSSSPISFPYLCLPLSYFPVESVLPYTAAESWLSERLLKPLLPKWRRGCTRTLRDWSALNCTSTTGVKKEVHHGIAACKVSYWFLHYAAPLLRTQLELHREAARCFYTKKLYDLAYPDEEEEEEYSTSEKAGALHRRVGRGSMRLLFHSAGSWCSWRRRGKGNGAVDPPATADTPIMAGSDDVSAASVDMGQRVRRALLLRAFSQGVSITLQVCFPRLSLRHVTEMAATGYCLSAAGAVSSPDATPSASTSADPSPPSSTPTVDALLNSLAAQMAWSIAAGVAEVFLQRIIGTIGGRLSERIAADVTTALEENLLHVDEAFFRRWLRGASLESGGSSSPPPQKLRSGSAGSYFVRRPPSADDVLSVGRRSGEKVMAVHDAVVKRWLRCTVLGLRAAATREWRPLVGAVATAWVDVPKLTSAFSVRVGYSLPQDVARLLSSKEGSLPSRSPAGLRLLMEVLVEEAEALEESQGASRNAASLWRRIRTAGRFSSLSHPFLALLVCARVWSFDHMLGEAQQSAATLSRRVRGARRLHTTVATFSFAHVGAVRCAASSLSAPHVRNAVAALQDDARCIAYYSLYHIEHICHARTALSTTAGAAAANTLHPLLDAEETQLLQTPSALAYLPEHVDFRDLFSLPYRFILRQLGLEMVFAYRTAMGMQQESRQMTEEWWTLTLFNSTFNPLTSALQECVQLLAACGTVGLLCTRVDGRGQLCFAPTTLTSVLQSSHLMHVYREVLRSGVALRQLEENVCPVQQLCEWLPCTIWSERSALQAATDCQDGPAHDEDRNSASSPSYMYQYKRCGPSTLQQRRRLWRRHLARHRPELLFDHDDRIVGGLRLRRGVSWHHVFFAYPQLFGAEHENGMSGGARGAVRPTLSDVTFTCPPIGMTAVIGPSGAGKSSLNLLLRRLYDPVPVIQQDQPDAGGGKASLDEVGLQLEAEDMLLEALRLAHVANVLPLPSLLLRSSPLPRTMRTAVNAASPNTQSNSYGIWIRPGYLALDEIPLSLFAATYIRQWFAWLPQTPTILPQCSFLQNVRVTSPFVTDGDAESALQLCGCRDFIEDRHRTMHDLVGPLSGGEGQRLALARVLASVYARRRVEVIQSCCYNGEEEDDGVEDGCGAVGGVALDEPTSRLDAINELRLLASLTALRESRTTGLEADTSPISSVSTPLLPLFVWMISHRMSSLRSAIFMVVVEDGAVTATGSPRDVLQRNIFARKQWQYQHLRRAAEGLEIDVAGDDEVGVGL
ncbi:putative mitochondrial ABC transporter family-like protein [Leptomonas pyrrhocoris]|uniref:Putative mitochondrial ABC transporter family-like protein n=1 Tax=Leptomonas pyrrhocoris TaxID=157538 RepID=A0A0N0VH30_LEPPY|nr:putative mitochondrial ABC transporter family-like protein [Leptomonas pyrrhocoris]KPA84424.1 putative mitochondrial ABC transporter family-like protein [Leptomonas pyrrhocoris]|eukprot:XP_015662863.1 putative mitochondrial ABC transporter family-like protein [Leptomonas pyrrhocoris]